MAIPQSTTAGLIHDLESETVRINFNSVNPSISDADLVSVCASFGENVWRYAPDYIRRTNVYMFTPDEFEE